MGPCRCASLPLAEHSQCAKKKKMAQFSEELLTTPYVFSVLLGSLPRTFLPVTRHLGPRLPLKITVPPSCAQGVLPSDLPSSSGWRGSEPFPRVSTTLGARRSDSWEGHRNGEMNKRPSERAPGSFTGNCRLRGGRLETQKQSPFSMRSSRVS